MVNLESEDDSFEELIMQAFINSRAQSFPVDIADEYASNSDRCCLNISFAGPKCNLLDNLDKIGVKLLNGITSHTGFNYDEFENKNILTVDVK